MMGDVRSTSEPSTAPPPSRRSGRRPGGQDTSAALLDAARAVFTESGYDGATVRAIAARAGVDAAMVNHWFGSKEGLFAEAILSLPFNPNDLVAELLDGTVDDLGERIVRRFLAVWDSADGGTFVALVRSIAGHEEAASVLRDFFVKYVFTGLLTAVGPDQHMLRANLCATQLVGLGMVRYVTKFEPMATTHPERLVTAIAPTLQRYLTGSID
jgi:AcrR family transcriptional regulator